MISLVKIFGHIQDLNRRLVESPRLDEDYIDTQVLSLAEELARYENELPSTTIFCMENLEMQVRRGQGRKFVALDLGYHHYATLLYYQYLDQRRPANINTKMFAQRCKYHAIQFCSLIRTASEHVRAEALHNIVGHTTIASSSVLLHTLLLGDEAELDEAKERLEFNFNFFVRLREIWPSVDLMMKRLITFQNACLRTAQLGTHRFNRCMVKFLLQNALALDEIEDSTAQPTPTTTQLHDQRLMERSRVAETIILGP